VKREREECFFLLRKASFFIFSLFTFFWRQRELIFARRHSSPKLFKFLHVTNFIVYALRERERETKENERETRV
jgi:hypothetical protein